MKNDPDQLEAEAQALIDEMQKASQPPVEDTAAADPDSPETDPQAHADTQEDEPVTNVRPEPEVDTTEPGDDPNPEIELLSERLRNAQAKMTKAAQEAADLRRENKALQGRVEALEAELAEKPEQDESDAELAKLAEDYPDIAGPLLKQLDKLKERDREIAKSRREDEQQRLLDKHFSTIEAQHPDYADVCEGDEFKEWLGEQSPTFRRIAKSGIADEVVDLLARFKTDKGLVSAKPRPSDKARQVAEPKLPKARSQQVSGKRVWTREEIKNMPIAEFERLEADIDKAFAEGRVR